MEQKQRALVLRLDDAKQELIGCVNNIMQTYGLSPYLVEPMFEDIYVQIKSGAQNELAQARENETRAQMTERSAKAKDNGAE